MVIQTQRGRSATPKEECACSDIHRPEDGGITVAGARRQTAPISVRTLSPLGSASPVRRRRPWLGERRIQHRCVRHELNGHSQGEGSDFGTRFGREVNHTEHFRTGTPASQNGPRDGTLHGEEHFGQSSAETALQTLKSKVCSRSRGISPSAGVRLQKPNWITRPFSYLCS